MDEAVNSDNFRTAVSRVGLLFWLVVLCGAGSACAAGDDTLRPNLRPFAGEPPQPNGAAADNLPTFDDSYPHVLEITDEPAPALRLAPLPTAGPAEAAPRCNLLTRCLPEGLIPAWGMSTPDSRKDRGIGDPLPGKGWRTNPFSISGFSGATNGGPLIRNHVLERPSYYGGVNFGWDYDHFWGIEKRLGFGALNLTNARHQPLQTGLSVTGEYRLMYYPLGDSRWRPFITAGVGWSDFYFQDDFNHHHLDTLFLFPFGAGLKYQCSERWALRIDLIDELTLGGGPVTTFHYVALTAGLEFRYGKRLLHFPWHRKDGS